MYNSFFEIRTVKAAGYSSDLFLPVFMYLFFCRFFDYGKKWAVPNLANGIHICFIYKYIKT